MDLVTAWRDTGTAPADRAHDLVPSVVAPKATGLGVMAPIDAVEASASIVAIAPEEHAVDARRAPGLWFTEDGRAPYVIFRAPRGGHWPPGTYRINAAWTQDGARRATSYHVELLPGAGASTDPLAALRLFAPVAGTEAIVGAAGLFATSRDLTCGDGDLAALPEVPAVIGIGHAQGDAPDAVEATLLLAGGRTVDQPLLVAAEAIDGLTLIAPANGPTFVPGIHRLTLRSGGEVRTVTACVGVGIPD